MPCYSLLVITLLILQNDNLVKISSQGVKESTCRNQLRLGALIAITRVSAPPSEPSPASSATQCTNSCSGMSVRQRCKRGWLIEDIGVLLIEDKCVLIY